jgi:hypothetical protein
MHAAHRYAREESTQIGYERASGRNPAMRCAVPDLFDLVAQPMGSIDLLTA